MTTTRPHHHLTAFLSVVAFLLFATLSAGHASSPLQDKNTASKSSPQTTPDDNTDVVTTTVTVTNEKGLFVTGLGKEAFAVFEGKNQRPITFFSDKEAPQSVGIIFDVSGSMSPLALEAGRGALVRFMQEAHPSNEYFILAFDKQLHPLTEWTRDAKTLIEALNRLSRIKSNKGASVFNDACAAGIEKVARGSNGLKVLLLVSDGQDTGSKTRFSRVLEMLKRSDVVVHAAGIVHGRDLDSSLGTSGRARLEEAASVSGGKAYFPSTEVDIEDTFDRIGLELRSQYYIGFTPGDLDGKWRNFKIKVTPPRKMRVFVRSREGYYAEADVN